MNSLQIDYFLAVAKHGSFTRAAQQYYISQPAISRVIASLEAELGFSLFDRMTRKTVLTPAGKLYYEALLKVKQLLVDVTLAAQALNATEAGAIHLGLMSGWDVSGFLPDFLASFQRRYPNISLHTTFLDPGALRKSLENGRLDAVLFIQDAVHQMPHMKVQPLVEHPRLLLYAKRHPLADREPLAPQVFKDTPFLAVEDETARVEELVAQYCQPYGFTPAVKLVPNIESMVAGVQNLQGVAIVDGWARERTNAAFGCLSLNSSNHIVLAWHEAYKNPVLPFFVDEIALHAHA